MFQGGGGSGRRSRITRTKQAGQTSACIPRTTEGALLTKLREIEQAMMSITDLKAEGDRGGRCKVVGGAMLFQPVGACTLGEAGLSYLHLQ